jgi:hypothetical protein
MVAGSAAADAAPAPMKKTAAAILALNAIRRRNETRRCPNP